MMKFRIHLFLSFTFLGGAQLFTHEAKATSVSLNEAIEAALSGKNGDFTVTLTDDISLTERIHFLPPGRTFAFPGQAITINGNHHTLNGNKTMPGFFLGEGNRSGINTTYTDMTFSGLTAQGGDGVNGGGGGLGAGGALFIKGTPEDSIP